MYPSSASASSSSPSQGSMATSTGGGGLMRYGSAPSSLLNTAVDSVIGATRDFSSFGPPQTHLAPAHFFPSQPSESTAMPNLNDGVLKTATNHSRELDQQQQQHSKPNTAIGLQRSYGFNSSSNLVRHSSSPAGFLNRLATAAAAENGFSITEGIGSYNTNEMDDNSQGISRLNSQLSFTRQETLSRIFEEPESTSDEVSSDNGQIKNNHSYTSTGFGLGSWDDSNQIMFAGSPSKRAKTNLDGHDTMGSQFQFSMPEAALEMATMENLLHIPQDSVACKIRAKRGFATHPRSIAERERRTRISGKLKKLQDIVPNMDKQTSYSDMLDLAVQHIKSLQNQLQNLNQELESCTCGCKKSSVEET